jgi:hypothetical protein
MGGSCRSASCRALLVTLAFALRRRPPTSTSPKRAGCTKVTIFRSKPPASAETLWKLFGFCTVIFVRLWYNRDGYVARGVGQREADGERLRRGAIHAAGVRRPLDASWFKHWPRRGRCNQMQHFRRADGRDGFDRCCRGNGLRINRGTKTPQRVACRCGRFGFCFGGILPARRAAGFPGK